MKSWLRILGTATLCLFLAACSSGGADTTPPEPPSLEVIEVTCSPDRVLADGAQTSTIRAFARNSKGTPVPDALIMFRIVQGGGYLDTYTATTSSFGEAEAEYTASTEPGVAVISVSTPSGDVETRALISNVANIDNPYYLDFSAIPRMIALKEESVLYAIVQDVHGRPLQSIIVYFDILSGGGSLEYAAAITNNAGIGEVSFTAPTYEDTILLRASVMTSDELSPKYISQTLTISVKNSIPEVQSVNLSANPAIIYTEDDSELFAFVSDETGKGIEGVEVFFDVRDTDEIYGALSSVVEKTDGNGQAKVTFTAGPNPTTPSTRRVKITAYSGRHQDDADIKIERKPEPEPDPEPEDAKTLVKRNILKVISES
ncbi:MAG: hypothetical protein EOM25_11330 [Deltaproteobacteria bacterium]|nr:hypothetical protein [Deltaproteobacteria bacterium]